MDTMSNVSNLRSETCCWMAMEDSLLVLQDTYRAIGVSNLETLRQTGRIWPPAVN